MANLPTRASYTRHRAPDLLRTRFRSQFVRHNRVWAVMPAPSARRLVIPLALCVSSALTAQPDQNPAHAPSPTRPLVYAADVDSIIHPVSAEYMIETIDRADRDGAALVVFTLRTPGGLLDATREIVSHIIAARTPIAVFVGPAGARAASAGFILTIAADIDAMAPGTHLGAPHPVEGGGEKMDATMEKKAAEDVAAYAPTLPGNRG